MNAVTTATAATAALAFFSTLRSNARFSKTLARTMVAFALGCTTALMPISNAAAAAGPPGCTSGWQTELGQPGPSRIVSAIRRYDGIVYAGSAEFGLEGLVRHFNGQWQLGSVLGQVHALDEFDGDLLVDELRR